MKKIGKKLSYLTKVFLVLGLLFSNLSGLSVVFAYEDGDNFGIKVEDNKIVIDYYEELEETDVINVMFEENYTYLDDTHEDVEDGVISIYGSDVTDTSGFEISSAMLNKVVFDGLYELKVSLYDDTTNTDLGTVIYSDNVVHQTGLSVSVFDEDTEILPVDGVYYVDGDVKVVSKVLAGGLRPTDTFKVDDTDYTAEELLNKEFESSRLFSGLLYGEYTDNVEVSALDNGDMEKIFNTEVNYMYGEYSYNADVLNTGLDSLGLSDKYQFEADAKDGYMYVYPNGDEGYSVVELFDFINLAVRDSEIEYIISNDSSDDLFNSYIEYLENLGEDEELINFDEYYADTVIDNSTVITIYNDGLVITFRCIILGDMNNDSVINDEDIQELINQVVGTSEANLDNGDLYKDDELNTLDVINLYQIYKDGTWELVLDTVETSLGAMLEVASDDIVSGDTFKVNYVLEITDNSVNTIAGQFKYDEEVLELVDVSSELGWIGSVKNGKFLYINGEELADEGRYVLLTATFKALKSGTSEVSVENPEFYNNNVQYILDNEIKTNVLVNASSDNTLSSLTVSGNDIALVDGVMDYQITVENETVSSVVEAITNNERASVSSIVAPEELAIGENKITITVVAENGDELIYTVTVIRKEAVKEENPTNMNYQGDDDTASPDDSDDTVIKDIDDEDDNKTTADDTEEEEGKLSRIIIIILILLVIAGLIYLIFKDDEDEDTKKTNKEINKMKKEDKFPEEKKEKVNKKNSNTRKNNKKER